jgi:hypothetical protein
VSHTAVIQHERRSLRDEMANEILDKQKKLEEEKSTMSLRGGAFRHVPVCPLSNMWLT